MKKLFLLLLASLVAMPNVAFASVNIISRQAWDANEELTIDNGPESVPDINGTSTDAERSDLTEQDPEIERVITHDENGRRYLWPLQYARDIKFVVLHYTAVTNNLDNPIQDIRNIYRSHAVGRGWGDIGYHFLIDRQGNVYEGRKGGNKIIGGHATPVNKTSIGISLMGNYDEEELPAPMLESLVELLDDVTKQYNIDPAGQTEYKGRTYFNIQGHEDNSPKIDPGRFGRQKLPYIRRLLAYKQGRILESVQERYDFLQLAPKNFIVAQPGMEKSFLIRLKNNGELAWNAETYLENIDEPKLPRVFARIDGETPPGATAEFRGRLPQIFESGMLLPSLKLVINASIRVDKPFPAPIMVEGLNTSYEIVERSDPPQTMIVGDKAPAFIKLRNTGNITWKRSGNNAIKIGTTREKDRPSNFFQGRNRIARLSEKEVRPGEVGKFVFRLEAANTPGLQEEFFAPVIDGIVWLPDRGMSFIINVVSAEKALRVALGFNKSQAQIKSESGMEMYVGRNRIRSFAANKTASVSIKRDGKYLVRASGEKIILDDPPRFSANGGGALEISNFPNRPSWNRRLNDNLYRGVLEVRKIDNELKIINELPLEDYLKGIAEVSNGDPPEKIKTIIILARSYAQYYRDIGRKFAGKPYHLDDDPNHTQKYLGYGFEMRAPNVAAAVNETAGKIVLFEGQQVITPYFNQSDGRTRSASEVWGWQNAPYLQSVPDAFCGSSQLRGHGVGLSGCGATALARAGQTAEEIIKYYYTGVEITDYR